MQANKKSIILLVFVIVFQLFSCKKETVSPEKKLGEYLKELVEKQKISRVIASDNQAFLNDLSFSEDYGFGAKFENDFVIIYGQTWNLAHLKRYEVVQRGNNFLLLLLFT